MKRMAFRLAAAVLAAALTAGTAVSAAGQPEVNQALRREWSQAAASQDPEQVLQAALTAYLAGALRRRAEELAAGLPAATAPNETTV